MNPRHEPPTRGEAFVKGGLGCLMLFVATGILVGLIGGRFHVDLGGLVLLFLIGGSCGLGFLAIYNRGRRDGGDNGQDKE